MKSFIIPLVLLLPQILNASNAYLIDRACSGGAFSSECELHASSSDNVFLVLAGPSLASPASSFGHLSIMVGSNENPLFNKTYSYFSDTYESPLSVQIANAGFSYSSAFVYEQPFFSLLHRYAEVEKREVYIVSINLNKKQKSDFFEFLKSEKIKPQRYNFFFENCTSFVQRAISAVLPEYSSLRFSSPASLVNKVIESDHGYIESIFFPPDNESFRMYQEIKSKYSYNIDFDSMLSCLRFNNSQRCEENHNVYAGILQPLYRSMGSQGLSSEIYEAVYGYPGRRLGPEYKNIDLPMRAGPFLQYFDADYDIRGAGIGVGYRSTYMGGSFPEYSSGEIELLNIWLDYNGSRLYRYDLLKVRNWRSQFLNAKPVSWSLDIKGRRGPDGHGSIRSSVDWHVGKSRSNKYLSYALMPGVRYSEGSGVHAGASLGFRHSIPGGGLDYEIRGYSGGYSRSSEYFFEVRYLTRINRVTLGLESHVGERRVLVKIGYVL